MTAVLIAVTLWCLAASLLAKVQPLFERGDDRCPPACLNSGYCVMACGPLPIPKDEDE